MHQTIVSCMQNESSVNVNGDLRKQMRFRVLYRKPYKNKRKKKRINSTIKWKISVLRCHLYFLKDTTYRMYTTYQTLLRKKKHSNSIIEINIAFRMSLLLNSNSTMTRSHTFRKLKQANQTKIKILILYFF